MRVTSRIMLRPGEHPTVFALRLKALKDKADAGETRLKLGEHIDTIVTAQDVRSALRLFSEIYGVTATQAGAMKRDEFDQKQQQYFAEKSRQKLVALNTPGAIDIARRATRPERDLNRRGGARSTLT